MVKGLLKYRTFSQKATNSIAIDQSSYKPLAVVQEAYTSRFSLVKRPLKASGVTSVMQQTCCQ
jgi:hypothetical protein